MSKENLITIKSEDASPYTMKLLDSSGKDISGCEKVEILIEPGKPIVAKLTMVVKLDLKAERVKEL